MCQENLDDEQDEGTKLQEALRLNEPLAVAYYVKEDLRRLWDWTDKKEAGWHLKSWIAMARASKIPIKP